MQVLTLSRATVVDELLWMSPYLTGLFFDTNTQEVVSVRLSVRRSVGPLFGIVLPSKDATMYEIFVRITMTAAIIRPYSPYCSPVPTSLVFHHRGSPKVYAGCL